MNNEIEELKDSKEIDHDAVVAMLVDDSQAIVIPSLYHLSDMPAEPFARLAKQWPTIDEIRRAQIARHMADISEENYQVDYATFTPLFLQDSHEAVRLALFDILWDNTTVSLISPIIKVMEEDPSSVVRAAAAANLGHYVLMMEWGQMPRTGEEKITTALLKQLRDDYNSLNIKRAALESIASIGTEEIHQFIKDAYTDKDTQLKLSAVFAMGRTADPRWINTIMQELDNSDPSMRVEAARAAGMIASSDPVEQLAEIAKYDDDIEVRIATVHALGQIGTTLANETLQELADEGDELESDDLAEAVSVALEEIDIFNFDGIDLSLIDYSEEEDEGPDPAL